MSTSVSSVQSAVELFLRHRSLKVKPESLELYERWLEMWLQWRSREGYPDDIHLVTQDEFIAFMTYLRDDHIPHGTNTHRPAVDRRGLAPASRDSIWRVLRTFWKHIGTRRMLLETQLDYFRDGAVPRPPVPLAPRPTYEHEVIEALLEACADDDRELEARNKAIILLLLESGMRVSELCSLRDRDINLGERQATIKGKGDKYGFVFWSERGDRWLRRYLARRAGPIGGTNPLFRGMNSRNIGGALSDDAIRSLLRRLAERASVKLVDGAPVHAIRHTFAHLALDRGIDSLHLQQLMRHESLQTTKRYSQENPTALRKIHRRMWDDDDDRKGGRS